MVVYELSSRQLVLLFRLGRHAHGQLSAHLAELRRCGSRLPGHVHAAARCGRRTSHGHRPVRLLLIEWDSVLVEPLDGDGAAVHLQLGLWGDAHVPLSPSEAVVHGRADQRVLRHRRARASAATAAAVAAAAAARALSSTFAAPSTFSSFAAKCSSLPTITSSVTRTQQSA